MYGEAVALKDDYSGMRMFVADDGRMTFAVTKDGDMVSLAKHRDSKLKNAAAIAFRVQTSRGGNRGDNFDTELGKIYTPLGGRMVARTAFNDEFVPDDWWDEAELARGNKVPKEKFLRYIGRSYPDQSKAAGRPDILFFVYDKNSIGSTYDPASVPEVKTYEDGVQAQRDALREMGVEPGFQRSPIPQSEWDAAPRSVNQVAREGRPGIIRRVAESMLLGLDTRARAIGGDKLRAILNDMPDGIAKGEQALRPVVEAFQKAVGKMSGKDYNRMWLAAMNGDYQRAEDLMNQYGVDPSVLNGVREMLDDMHHRAEMVGMDINYVTDYFPRGVRNYKAYVRQMAGLAADFPIGEIDLMVKKFRRDHNRSPTQYEFANLIRQRIQGTGRSGASLPNNVQQRRVDVVTWDTLGQYEKFDEYLMKYALDMNRAIATREWLNRHAKPIERLTNATYGGVPSYRQIMRDLRAEKLLLKAMYDNPAQYTTQQVQQQEAAVEALRIMSLPINGVANVIAEMVHTGQLKGDQQERAIELFSEALAPEVQSPFLNGVRALGNALALGQRAQLDVGMWPQIDSSAATTGASAHWPKHATVRTVTAWSGLVKEASPRSAGGMPSRFASASSSARDPRV